MKKRLNYVDFSEACKSSLELCSSIEKSVEKSEIISSLDSLGRVLYKDIVCIKNLPSFDNSAMDGFACRIEDLGKFLKIKDSIFAGDKKELEELKSGECYKIMTGAKVPKNVDLIAPFEICETLEDSVKIPENIKIGSNIRLKGEEQKKGSTLLKKGEKITSSHIAMLASQGIMAIEVYRKIQIAIISSGNELKEPWEMANEDEIYNINAFFLKSFLQEHHFSSNYCGVVPDDFSKSVDFIESLKDFDVIITSGGISMGDADFLANAFLECGLKIAYHGVNIKPGRAMMTGIMGKSLVVALPGNPLASIINAYIFLLPLLKKLQGETNIYHDFIECKNKKSFKVKEQRVEAILGRVTNGVFEVTRDNKYGSAMISAIYESNALMLSSGAKSEIQESEFIKVLEFNKKFVGEKINFLN